MIVTRETARLAVVDKIIALTVSSGLTEADIEYDNLVPINRATQTNPFLSVAMIYTGGYQTSLGANSPHRPLGTIVLEVWDKEGAGTLRSNNILEHFYRGLHMTDSMPPVRTYAARFSYKLPYQGWAAQTALIPFWYDTE